MVSRQGAHGAKQLARETVARASAMRDSCDPFELCTVFTLHMSWIWDLPICRPVGVRIVQLS